MMKSRGNTNEGGFGISPVDNMTKYVLDAEETHTHDWQFARHVESRNTLLLKFVCHCGAAKYPEQFEVEE